MTDDEQFVVELRAMADRAHAAGLGTESPPIDTLDRVLDAVKSEMQSNTERGLSMRTSASRLEVATWGRDSDVSANPGGIGGSIHRYAKIVATIALVLAVAAGGWFTMVHLQPEQSAPRMAVVQATPDSGDQTCDVAPLSVDEVMAIVRNPVPFMHAGAVGSSSVIPDPTPQGAELFELSLDLELFEASQVPTEEQFQSASTVANQYVTCMVFGTQGQVWRFYSPASIQKTILAEFPVFAEESQVQARVEERLSEPAYEGDFAWEVLSFIPEIRSVTINPDRQLAIVQASESSYYDQVMSIGVVIEDVDGNVVAHTNGTGRNLIPNDPTVTGRNDVELHIVIAKSRGSDTWSVIPWPSATELGFPSTNKMGRLFLLAGRGAARVPKCDAADDHEHELDTRHQGGAVLLFDILQALPPSLCVAQSYSTTSATFRTSPRIFD